MPHMWQCLMHFRGLALLRNTSLHPKQAGLQNLPR